MIQLPATVIALLLLSPCWSAEPPGLAAGGSPPQGAPAAAKTTAPVQALPPWTRDLAGTWSGDPGVAPTVVFAPPRMWTVQGALVHAQFVRFLAEGVIEFRGLDYSWQVDVGHDLLRISARSSAGAALGSIRLRRQPAPPRAFVLEPLPCAPQTALPPGRLAAIAADIDQRFAVMAEVNARTMGGRSGALSPEMLALTAGNEARLAALCAEVGWFDTARFPARLVDEACALAQQSSWPALQLAVRAALERDPSFQRQYPLEYARAVDRAQASLCEEQEYGTQMMGGPGGPYDCPLRDPVHVDGRRAALGMGPLAAYLAQRTGGRPVAPLP